MISCQQYDTIEIVCMYHYSIKLTLQSGVIIEGIARDTQQNKKREECIKVEFNGVDKLIVLDDISKLDVCVDNPHFKQVTFD